MTDVFPPGLILMVGALFLPAVCCRTRFLLVTGLPLLTLGAVWSLPAGTEMGFAFLHYELTPVQITRMGRVFATIFALMAFGGGLFALPARRPWEEMAAFVYAGAAVGAVLAGDLVSLFVFWEIMAVASAALVLGGGQARSRVAGMRYFLMHVSGGVVLMVGLGLHISTTGSLEIMELAGESTAARLMLAGFLINAAAPPVSGWLSDAYPEGSFFGTVFLSAFSTNTAVYALLRMGPGLEVLVWLGAFMAVYSVIWAAVEVDMRRILAFAIINQIGVMLCGVGLGSEMAVNGVSAHAVSHVVSLSLLLMTAGSVLHMTGRRTLTELGGLYRYMPVTTVCAIIGVLALSVPGTAGFVSRSLILNAAAEAHRPVLWFVLMGASAALFAFPGLRFVWYVFFAGRAPREGADLTDPPGLMQAAMVLLALLGLGIGLYPPLLYDLLPTPVTYVPYTLASVVGMAQLLLFCGLAFFFSRRILSPARTKITLDLDVVWRKWIPAFGHVAFSAGRFVDNAVRRGTLLGVRCLMLEFVEDAKRIEAIQIGGAVVWGAVLLMFSLVFYVL